jgi:hypothetical protein
MFANSETKYRHVCHLVSVLSMLTFSTAFQFQYCHRNETLTGKAESCPSFCIPRHMSMHTKHPLWTDKFRSYIIQYEYNCLEKKVDSANWTRVCQTRDNKLWPQYWLGKQRISLLCFIYQLIFLPNSNNVRVQMSKFLWHFYVLWRSLHRKVWTWITPIGHQRIVVLI